MIKALPNSGNCTADRELAKPESRDKEPAGGAEG